MTGARIAGLARSAQRIRWTCASVAAAVVITASAGWALGLEQLASLVAGWATMKVNTALALGALCVALAVPRLRMQLALLAGGIGGLSLLEWVAPVDLGIDELLAADPASAASNLPPGRMAAATALGIGLVALGLGTAASAPGRSQGFAAGALVVAWIALLGYACEVAPLSSVWLYGTVSLPTAIALAALAVGTWTLRPDDGWLRVVTGDDAGATLLRRLGIPAVLLPSVTAWGAFRAQRGLDWPFGFTLAVGATVDAVILAGLLATTSAAVRRQERRLAELTHALIRVQEAERRTIAHELHDEFGQTLTALGLLIERGRKHPEATEEARVLLTSLTDGVRRMSLELRPSILDDLGLVPALRWLVGRWPVPVALSIDGDRRTTAEVELAAYRIAQEALTNAARHATGPVAVRVHFGEEALRIEVRDAGGGIAVAEDRPTLGLYGMAERARAVGGALDVDSGAKGTVVRAILPAPKRHS